MASIWALPATIPPMLVMLGLVLLVCVVLLLLCLPLPLPSLSGSLIAVGRFGAWPGTGTDKHYVPLDQTTCFLLSFV